MQDSMIRLHKLRVSAIRICQMTDPNRQGYMGRGKQCGFVMPKRGLEYWPPWGRPYRMDPIRMSDVSDYDPTYPTMIQHFATKSRGFTSWAWLNVWRDN